MAQPGLAPEDSRAGGPQTSPTSRPPPPAVPPSPVRSLWRRFLSRGVRSTRHGVSPTPSAKAPPAALPGKRTASHDVPRQPVTTVAVKPVSPASPVSPVSPVSSLSPANPASPPVFNAAASKPSGSSRRPHREVVPGLPRAQTFARQQSELRENLLAVKPSPDERRATSMDRRLLHSAKSLSTSQTTANPRASAPNFGHGPRKSAPDFVTLDSPGTSHVAPHVPLAPSLKSEPSAGALTSEGTGNDGTVASTNRNAGDAAPGATYSDLHGSLNKLQQHHQDDTFHLVERASLIDTASMTSSQYEQTLLYELEHIWILNLSMHFRDKSRREKFFVTYRQRPDLWRRVTVSLDYRNAPENSLEMDLLHTKFQRDKNEKIYEAIRESLSSIQFYETVTNLKLQTTDGRLHVHVVEDVTEIIKYPTSRMVQHLSCRIIRERAIEFDSHMSGFVYKVRVDGRMLIKKEIPGPDSVDEFLYEVNALNFLSHSRNVIEFYGVIVNEHDCVTGLLIDFAEQGALIDIIYDSDHGIPWPTRAKWARQIVQGLSEIHEAGYVQGDFTLSNIVIDDNGNAKIIDINRRGCPVGWEPPEATPLIENKQRISMYIGVKSDLYQLGMVLWALTMQDDEPEAHHRPLHLPGDVTVPSWFRTIVETCLEEDPRARAQASQLVRLFPVPEGRSDHSDISDYDEVDWVGDRRPPGLYEHNPPLRVGDDSVFLRNDTAVLRGPVGYSDDADTGLDSYPADGVTASSSDWSYVHIETAPTDSVPRVTNEKYSYPARGRSPPNARRRSYNHNSQNSFSDDKHDSPDVERQQHRRPTGDGGRPTTPTFSPGADPSTPKESALRRTGRMVEGAAASGVLEPESAVADVGGNIDEFDPEDDGASVTTAGRPTPPPTGDSTEESHMDFLPTEGPQHNESQAETSLAASNQPDQESSNSKAAEELDSGNNSSSESSDGGTALENAKGRARQ